MRKLLVVSALMLATLSTVASADEWTGEDKKLHMAGSAALGLVATAVFKDTDHPVLYPLAAVMAVGLAKEIRDEKATGGSGFSYKDLAADALGALVGVSVGTGVIYFTHDTVGYKMKW